MKTIYLLVLCLMLEACTSPVPTTPPPIMATSTPAHKSLAITLKPTTPSPLTATSMPAYKDLIITLQRGPCNGNCAVYQLTIYGDGSVNYLGQANVAIEGKRTSVLNRNQIEELVAAFEQANYFSLRDHYPESTSWSGDPSTTISITLNGRSKSIWHQGVGHNLQEASFDTAGNVTWVPCVPAVLCELEEKIDATVNVAQWVDE